MIRLLLVSVVAGIVMAVVIMVVLYKIIGRAVDNGLRWLIVNFGNERASRRAEELPDEDGPSEPR